jgi:hypothetical protein
MTFSSDGILQKVPQKDHGFRDGMIEKKKTNTKGLTVYFLIISEDC